MNTTLGHLGLSIDIGQAVLLFFAMSGFVMTRCYYVARRSFLELVVGRIARLYPLHFLTLVWALTLALVGREQVNWYYAGQSLVLLHNIGLPPNAWSLNGPSWSVSVEFVVSVVFFFIALRSGAIATITALLVTGLLANIAIAMSSAQTPAENVLQCLNCGLLSGVAWFSLGCAAYLTTDRCSTWLLRLRWITPVALCALVPCFFLPRSLAVTLSFYPIVFAALVLSATHDRATFLSRGSFTFLGSVSYSIYLLHMPVYWTLEFVLGAQNVRGAVGKAFILFCVIVVSTLSYLFFELPAKRYITRWKPARSQLAV